MARIQNMKSVERLKHWEEFMSYVNMNESSSTQDSRFTPREQLLQAKGQEYETHKQNLRKQKEKDQLSKSPFKPKINSNYQPAEKVENRLIRYGQVTESKLEKIRREKLQNEEKLMNLSKSPSKNIDCKALPDRLWNKQKLTEKKIESQRIEKIENEEKQLKSPEICKKSQQLVSKHKRPEAVEDRLYNSAKNFSDRVQSEKSFQSSSHLSTSKPQITELAKNLPRKGNITDRLLNYKHYYDNHLKELEQKYNSTPSTSPKRSNSTARERLLKAKAPLNPSPSHSFHPSISSNSSKLALHKGSSTERLLKPSSSQTKTFEEPDCYFRPIINQNSKKIDNRKEFEGERWESLYCMRGLKDEKREQLITSFNVPDPECTFKPQVRERREADSEGLVRRLNGWKEEIEGKVAEKRKKFIQEELRECTFSPDLQKNGNFVEISPRTNVREKGYSKKYQEVSAGEFLSKLEELHARLHSDS